MANLGFTFRSDLFTAQHYCLKAAVLKDAAGEWGEEGWLSPLFSKV